MTGISAPVFFSGGTHFLLSSDLNMRDLLPTGPFTLAGPGETAEPGHLPVRGDLAHIRLAGRYFVPHYAVPMPHVVKAGGAVLRRAGREDGEALATLAAGEVFNVLDIAGGWTWGQLGDDGLVGYVARADLERAAA